MKRFILLSSMVSALATGSAFSQWTDQSILLRPGWNAVYLEVHPEANRPFDEDERALDVIFEGVPVQSVWQWNQDQSSVEFITDPADLVPELAEWSTYFAVDHPQRFLTDLIEMRGGRAYMVELGGSADVTLNLRGKPAPPSDSWVPDGFTLRGFGVMNGGTTFANFFRGSPAHAGRLIFSLNTAGRWVFTQPTTAIEVGKAYWIQTVGASSFTGPVEIELERKAGIDFGTTLTEAEIVLRNRDTVDQTVTLAPTLSESMPAGAVGASLVAGDIPLMYRDYSDLTDRLPVGEWRPLTAPLSIDVTAGDERLIRVAIDRSSLADPAEGVRGKPVFQSLLSLEDSAGGIQLVPVTASRVNEEVSNSRARSSGAAVDPKAGLWVGTVTLDKVSWAGDVSPDIVDANPAFDGADRTTPRETKSDFLKRIIVHVDESGEVKLLQKVVQVWEEGTRMADPLNPGLTLPEAGGRFRLFSNEAAAAPYVGSALRDGKTIPKRISTPGYPLRTPLAMTCSGGFGVGICTGILSLGYDDSLNPFKHGFHPQHDNWNAGYTEKLPAGVESFDIQRAITLEFATENPLGVVSPTWGDSEVGGSYKETLSGVHKRDVFISGTFFLRRVSPISTLD